MMNVSIILGKQAELFALCTAVGTCPCRLLSSPKGTTPTGQKGGTFTTQPGTVFREERIGLKKQLFCLNQKFLIFF